MSWQCAECRGTEESDKISVDVVCHHCGKPLCPKCRIAIADDAFWREPAANRPNAFHCDDCRKRYHPQAQRAQ